MRAPTPLDDFVRLEMCNLREELRDLKSYQFRLLSITPVVTGFLLSVMRFRSEPGSTATPAPSLYLLPLIVVLPSWWLFFDKAKTITRIVGYYRILEDVARGDVPSSCLGWECALGKFRTDAQNVVKDIKEETKTPTFLVRIEHAVRHVRDLVTLQEAQRYWPIAYLTFLLLSVISLYLPIRSRFPLGTGLKSALWHAESWLFLFALLVTLYCAAFNLGILWKLIWGEHSYDNLEKVWRRVLNIPEVKR